MDENKLIDKNGIRHENAPIGIWPFTKIDQTEDQHRVFTTGFKHPGVLELDIVPNIRDRENITIFILVLSGVLMVILVGCCVTLMKATDFVVRKEYLNN